MTIRTAASAPPVLTCKKLRIVYTQLDDHWESTLQELAKQMGVRLWVSNVLAEVLEVTVEAPRAQIESIGLEILHGGLGFSPITVIVQRPCASYHLRRINHSY